MVWSKRRLSLIGKSRVEWYFAKVEPEITKGFLNQTDRSLRIMPQFFFALQLKSGFYKVEERQVKKYERCQDGQTSTVAKTYFTCFSKLVFNS